MTLKPEALAGPSAAMTFPRLGLGVKRQNGDRPWGQKPPPWCGRHRAGQAGLSSAPPRAQLGAVAPAVSGSGGPGLSTSLHVPRMSSLRGRSFGAAGEREDRKEGREFQPTIVQLLMLLRVFRQGV